MDLPPGPRAPAAWQTVAWTMRPAAFLRGVHDRFGDPATIRTYWTDEPMVLFSHPDAVREVFRLDPEIAPAGQSWEFLRPFAGEHSILVLDGEEHMRERRLLQAPFHGARMRAFTPTVAELARRELGAWRGRVITLERMKHLTLETILRVVFGARGERGGRPAARRRPRHARHRPLDAAHARDGARAARPRAAQPVGPRSASRSSASTRCCSTSSRAAARRAGRRLGARPAPRAARRGRQPADGPAPARPARRAAGRRPRHLGGVAGLGLRAARAASRGPRAPARGRPRLSRRGRQGGPARAPRADDRAAPAARAGADRRAHAARRRARGRLPVAGDAPRGPLARRPRALRPERWLEGPPPNPMSWIPFGGGVRRCAGAPFAEMEMREVLRAAAT